MTRERPGPHAMLMLTPVLFLAAACARGPAPPSFAQPTPAEASAIAIAERFVLANGYTDVIPDPRQIKPEFMEGGAPPSVVWQLHHNTLRPKAYGISAEQGAHQPGWTVFFELTSEASELRGVEMSPDLRQVWMCHYELRLDAPAKVLRARTRASGNEARGRRTRG
jgi:hypothetical protein